MTFQTASNIYGHFIYFETAQRDENPLVHCIYCEGTPDERLVPRWLKDVFEYDTGSCATMVSNFIIFLCLLVLLIMWLGGCLPE